MKPDDAGLTPAAGTGVVDAWALRDGRAPQPTQETLIDEQPVALELNGIGHAVMLATPLDLEDFALGFLLTEGLIENAADLLDVEADTGEAGTVLRLSVTARCEVRFKDRRRAMAGRTGCGLCGIDSLDQLDAAVTPVPAGPVFELAGVTRAMKALVAHQPLQHLTGAAHAAAWCRADGTPVLVREDVGRHNALDKLVGALAKSAEDAGAGFIVVTSRASYEMVHKAARTGAGLLAAVSAPTRRAVAHANDAGLTLAGFVREGRATVYTHPERLRETR